LLDLKKQFHVSPLKIDLLQLHVEWLIPFKHTSYPRKGDNFEMDHSKRQVRFLFI